MGRREGKLKGEGKKGMMKREGKRGKDNSKVKRGREMQRGKRDEVAVRRVGKKRYKDRGTERDHG